MRTAITVILALCFASCGLQADSTTAGSSPAGNPALALNTAQESMFVRPGETVLLSMDVSNLPRKVNACQAFLGFSSQYLTAQAGCVQAGGGVWDELIYNSWDVGSGVPGEIDTAIGLDAQGSVGTEANGTVASIRLTAGSTQGSTQVVFRADAGDTQSTFFSDLEGLPLYPDKTDSQMIVIDGTAPVVAVLQPNGGETLRGGRVHEIRWTASDLNFGQSAISIEYSPDGGDTWLPVASAEPNDGVYEWTVPAPLETDEALIRVTATDLAGNSASDQSDGVFSVRAMNRLALDVEEQSLFVQPGGQVLIDMNVTNLGTKVNACQAMLAFSSYYLSASAGCVEPGGGVWDQLIYNSWDVGSGVEGEIDTAIGLDAQGSVGTEADATVAKITLTAGQHEGITNVLFRPDGSDTESTFFSDLAGQPVWPVKINSLNIIIDGTPPAVTVLQPNGGEMLVGGQSYEITWTASDTYLHPHPVKIEYSADGGAHWTLVAADEDNDGAYTWTVPMADTTSAKVRLTARDRAGNHGQDESDAVFSIDSSGPSLSFATARQDVSEGTFNAPGFTYRKIVNGGSMPLPGASFSPDGRQIVYIERTRVAPATYYVKLLDRPTGTVTVLAQAQRTATPGIGFNSYLTPYFSADGAKIGWNKAYYNTCNELQVCDLLTSAITTYRPQNPLPPPDVANSDFYGSFSDQWVAWDYAPTLQSDLKIYGASYTAPNWFWQVKSSLTATATIAEYEPDSDRAGNCMVYYSGGTQAEPMYTVHQIRWNGTAWVKDSAFTQIVGATWPYWSADETEIGLSKYDNQPGTGRADLYVYDSAGNFRFDLTGTAVPQYQFTQNFGFNFAVGPTGAGREYLFLSNAGNTDGGRDIWIARNTPELLYSARIGAASAVQGHVFIDLVASDAVSGMVGPPEVTVTDSAGQPIVVSLIGVNEGVYRYQLEITPEVANGMATVLAGSRDHVGHVTSDIDYFDVNKARTTGTVSFNTLSGDAYAVVRDVTFKATDLNGSVLKTWTVSPRFENDPVTRFASAQYMLDDIPAAAADLSAKSSHSLRKRHTLTHGPDGQSLVDFVLVGGDIDGDNKVISLDYSALKAKWMTSYGLADINGDGMVQLLDYSLLKMSWYTIGESE